MTTKANILKIIRRKCLDCSVFQATEVRLCPATACDLWPFRFGTDPRPSKVGFAKNPSACRGISEKERGRAGPAPHSPNNQCEADNGKAA
jgi:hypothetical protein